MKFFLTHSARHLQRSLTNHGCETGRWDSYFFADRERGYRLKEDVQGEPAAVIASILPDPGSLFDLMALCRLAGENGATRTTLIVPYLGYARQDRPNRPGEASIGVMIAELLQNMRLSLLVLFDLHSDLIRRAFGSSILELSALPLFAAALAKEPPDVIVAPDAGSVSKAEELAKLLPHRPEIAVIDKVRPRPNLAIAKSLHGNVRDKSVVIVDDMIDTGGTIAEAVKLVSGRGATPIRLAATHGIFSGHARERLSRLPISEVFTTNTLPQVRFPNIRTLDIVPLLLGALAQPGPRSP